MRKMIKILFLLFIVLNVNSASIENSWISVLADGKLTWKKCLQSYKFSKELQEPWKCLANGSLSLFNKIVEQDTVPLDDGINLVRYKKSIQNKLEFDGSGLNSCLNTNKTWSNCILNKISETFETHVLQIDLGHVFIENSMARHRRRNQMLPMMVFGITALGMVLVPLGFQFLAVLGGKALLLSKMALLLASMNGLKKVATSGVSYGLYHAVQDPHSTNGWY